jgi:hypothetical protein
VAQTSPTLPTNTNKVPKPSRAILSTDNVQELISEAAVCRFCRRKTLSFTVDNVGITSIPSIQCLSCDRDKIATPPTTAFYNDSSQRRLLDYAANVLFVLGFLSVGDGGREANHLLGLLDLPNLISMESKTFVRIEKEIAPIIINVAEDCLQDNLIQEVKSSDEGHPPGFDVAVWKEALLNGDIDYPEALYPLVRAGTDMGWQQRRGAQDSLSGHAFLFGANTQLPLWWNIRQKGCRICSMHKGDGKIPVHNCQINHEGSSKSMEPQAVVSMVTDLFDQFRCGVRFLITNDDSTMKAKNCRWSNEDYKKEFGDYPRVPDKDGKLKKRNDTGILRHRIPQPDFLADPNHRVKTVRNTMKKLYSAKVAETAGCMEIDTLRIAKNFAYFIRTLAAIPEEEWETASAAVIDHHFDIHEGCGAFCK